MNAPLTDIEKRSQDAAVEFARKYKKVIAKRFTDPNIFRPEHNPVSVFMAGSPGAGKTEASIALLETIETDGASILRIDPDELRDKFEGYTGDNSWLFHSAVSILVDRIHDMALKQKQSFILDGTLASHDVATKNISRSLRKGRAVQILYVYQDPIQAWQFVLAREEQEGRRIRREDFIRQHFAARDSVNKLKGEFKQKIRIDLLIKNNDGTQQTYKANVDQIDNHVPENYSAEELEAHLNDPHNPPHDAKV